MWSFELTYKSKGGTVGAQDTDLQKHRKALEKRSLTPAV
jgi:hypothetical protein